jgi:hypothetical protein
MNEEENKKESKPDIQNLPSENQKKEENIDPSSESQSQEDKIELNLDITNPPPVEEKSKENNAGVNESQVQEDKIELNLDISNSLIEEKQEDNVTIPEVINQITSSSDQTSPEKDIVKNEESQSIPINKETSIVENEKSEWMLEPLNIPSFKPLDPVLIERILTHSSNLSPIIREMFETIFSICLNDFNFSGNKILVEKYKEFYQEVNRLIPNLKRKIIEDTCYSDVFFVGDSHGSIEDSFLIIDFFYKLMQKDPKLKIIFVGDYVDRNPWDLENLTLVVAFAFLCPNNVVLLRGNHEDRTINTHYGFIDNLLRAFWDAGESLYEEIIKFFTHLPLIHISNMVDLNNNIAARILSTHGGIPIDPFNFLQPVMINELESKLVCEKERSEEMDHLSVSLLWSDPDEMIQGIINDGDSGRMRFGYPVFDSFMRANGLHIHVRGHQKWNDGFKTFFNSQMYSLFSTSKYDNKKRFNPKILQLSLRPPKPPQLLDITKQSLDYAIEIYQKS